MWRSSHSPAQTCSSAAARSAWPRRATATTPWPRRRARHPDRIRWFASLPWQFPELAVAELERALSQGASGVVVLGNIAGQPLTDALFAPVWRAIDDRALPVFIHPTAPPGVAAMGMDQLP